jgi:ribonuclease VapC
MNSSRASSRRDFFTRFACGRADLDRLLRVGGFEVVGVTPRHAEIAIDAFRRFGKARHKAGLNIGACFSYALAIGMDHELLFKGSDFIHADVRRALPATG